MIWPYYVLEYSRVPRYVRTYVRTRVRTNITLSQKQLEIQALRYVHVYVRTMVRTYNVMSQLSDWKRAHMCTENHVCFGRVHGSQLREGANAGQHTPVRTRVPPRYSRVDHLLSVRSHSQLPGSQLFPPGRPTQHPCAAPSTRRLRVVQFFLSCFSRGLFFLFFLFFVFSFFFSAKRGEIPAKTLFRAWRLAS